GYGRARPHGGPGPWGLPIGARVPRAARLHGNVDARRLGRGPARGGRLPRPIGRPRGPHPHHGGGMARGELPRGHRVYRGPGGRYARVPVRGHDPVDRRVDGDPRRLPRDGRGMTGPRVELDGADRVERAFAKLADSTASVEEPSRALVDV